MKASIILKLRNAAKLVISASEDELHECDFVNALEAAAVNVKRQIAELTGVQKGPNMASNEENLDFGKLPWQKKTGTKGEFEQTSEKVNNNSELWQQLRAKLKEHSGFRQYRGYKYWFDRQQGSVVDRRKIGT